MQKRAESPGIWLHALTLADENKVIFMKFFSPCNNLKNPSIKFYML